MSATTTFIEGEPTICRGVFGDSSEELNCVVSRYLPMFYQRALRFLGNAPDAEDAVQDALLSAYTHLEQFRGQAQLSTWLMTIVTNAALMQLRRRHNGYFSLDQEQGEEGLTFSERLPDSKPSPEEVCSIVEARNRLAEGVQRLSPKLRRTFQLRDIDGLTTKEAARALGVPEGTVKARLARARAALAGIVRGKPVRRGNPNGFIGSSGLPERSRSANSVWDEPSVTNHENRVHPRRSKMPHTMLQTAGDLDLGSEISDFSRERCHPSNATFAECRQVRSG
jgi:RNA polymerase sigma-70 factor (ECF subfamily)